MSQQEVTIDIHTGEFWLWNKQLRQKSTWNINAFFSRFPPEVVGKMKNNAMLSIKTFDPYKGLQKEWPGVCEGVKVKYLNTYRPPVWYDRDFTQAELGTMKETYPAFFSFFMEKLFPIPEHKEIVLDWMSLAIFGRPISYLCLRGIRGNGKSIFKLLLYHLVGTFYEASSEILSDFNADLKEKRIVGIDDKKAIGTRNGYYLRKNLLNPTMSYNTKFVQTQESERQFASVVIISNNADKFYMEFDERRIVSPLMGSDKMESWATEQHYSWLRAFEEQEIETAHLEFIRQVGRSLLTRYFQKGPTPNIQLKAGYFWSDVLDSLPSFYRYTLQKILDRTPDENEIDYEDIRANYKLEEGMGNIPQWPTVTRWLNSGFYFLELPLLDPRLTAAEQISFKEKTFMANPALCQRKYGEKRE